MNNTPIREIKERLKKGSLTEQQVEQLRLDLRKGVQRLIKTYDKQLEKKRQANERFIQKRMFDKQFIQDETLYVAGVDEAGRGPLAGPVVSAAVILPNDFYCLSLDDS